MDDKSNNSNYSTNINFTLDAETIIKQTLANKYEIISLLGKGGMANVYKAKQLNLNRIVALKVVHLNLIHDEEFIKRFLREAKIGSQLNHANIVKTYDIGSVGGIHYIAMEYLDGEDLHNIIKKKGKLSVDETVKYISQIARALGYAHKQGLVHRDIKSSNIFITKEGRAVLTDFGIAHAKSGTVLTQAGTIIGTPEYMSPEQAEGKKIDGRSDLYSLGVVLYECLVGRVPFKADNPLTVINKVLTENPPKLSTQISGIPAFLETITERLLTKEPSKRIQTAEEFVELLNKRDATKLKQSSQQSINVKSKELAEPNKTLKINSLDELKQKEEEEEDERDYTPEDAEKDKQKVIISLIVVGIVVLIFILILSTNNTKKNRITYYSQQPKQENVTRVESRTDRLLSEAENLLRNRTGTEEISRAYAIAKEIYENDNTNYRAKTILEDIANIYINNGDDLYNYGKYEDALKQYSIAANILPYTRPSLFNKIENLKKKIEANKVIYMPNLKGRGKSYALRRLRKLGVRVNVLEIISNKKGIVINQLPKPGKKLRKKQLVTIWVGK